MHFPYAASLEAALAQSEAEIARYKQRRDELVAENDALRAELAAAEEKHKRALDDARATITVLSEDLDRANEQRARQQREKEERDQLLTELEARKVEAQEVFRDWELAVAARDAKIQELQATLEEKEAALAEAQSTGAAHAAKLQEELDALRAELRAAQEALHEAEAQRDAAAAEAAQKQAALQAEVEAVHAQIDQLKAERERLSESLHADAEQMRQTWETRLTEEHERVADLDTKLAAVRADLASAEVRRDQNELDMKRTAANLRVWRGERCSLEPSAQAARQAAEGKLADREAAASGAESRLRELQDTIDSLQAGADDAKAVIQDWETAVAARDEQLAAAATREAALSEQLEAAQRNLEAVEARLADVEAARATLLQERDDAITQAQAQRAQHETVLAAARAEADALTQSLEEARQRLATAQADKAALEVRN